MKPIPWREIHRLSFHDVQLHIGDVLWPAIAGRSAGPESIAPAVVMDSGLAHNAIRASRAPRNDNCRGSFATDPNQSKFEIDERAAS
jgi:hypothetical protein